ncbi:MAG: hypothetical protein HYS09_06075 [Chloroflexi bacterium]|nr:hypothetical protein [Chloroflexota bacterium]
MLKTETLTKGNRGMLFLALFFGVMFAVLVTVYLSRAGGGTDGGGAGVPVVVAAQDIPAGTQITKNMLTIKKMPSSLVLPDGFEDQADVAGKVAVYPITAGEQVLGGDFAAGLLENASLADIVPARRRLLPCESPNPNCGLRAVSVGIADDTASGGLIRPGDHVDVILALHDASAVTVLQDVEVLAIGSEVTPKVTTGQTDPGVNPDSVDQRQVVQEGDENPQATTATLAVTPAEAQVLAAAEEFAEGTRSAGFDCEGSIRLTVRNRNAQQSEPIEARIVRLDGRGPCGEYFTGIWGS